MKTISFDDLSSNEVRQLISKQLKSGAIVVYPTDTVAGIGCIGTSEKLVKKLFNIKQRPIHQPVSYAFSSVQMLESYVKIPTKARNLLSLLPGPITLIFPQHPDRLLHGTDGVTIGVRIFDFPKLNELIELVGEPIITTSANISGQPTASAVAGLTPEFLSNVDILITWENELIGAPSTVVSCVDDIKILRQGVIPENKIFDLITG